MFYTRGFRSWCCSGTHGLVPQTESVKQSFHCEAAGFSVVVWLVGLHSEEGNQLIWTSLHQMLWTLAIQTACKVLES